MECKIEKERVNFCHKHLDNQYIKDIAISEHILIIKI